MSQIFRFLLTYTVLVSCVLPLFSCRSSRSFENNRIQVEFVLNLSDPVFINFTDKQPVYINDCFQKFMGLSVSNSLYSLEKPSLVWVHREYDPGTVDSAFISSVVLRKLLYHGDTNPLRWREVRRFELAEKDYGIGGFKLKNNDKIIVFCGGKETIHEK